MPLLLLCSFLSPPKPPTEQLPLLSLQGAPRTPLFLLALKLPSHYLIHGYSFNYKLGQPPPPPASVAQTCLLGSLVLTASWRAQLVYQGGTPRSSSLDLKSLAFPLCPDPHLSCADRTIALVL